MGTTGRGRWECVVWSSQLDGLGQILCGRALRGLVWLILMTLTGALGVFSLYSRYVSRPEHIAALFTLAILLRIGMLVDAYRCGRKQEAPSLPSSANPAWRAVFLSALIPGLGQLTLRKYVAATIFFGIWIVSPFLPRLLFGPIGPFFCVPLLGLSFPSQEIILLLTAPVAAAAILHPLVSLARSGHAAEGQSRFRIPAGLVVLVLLNTVFMSVALHALGRVNRSAPTGSMEPTLTGGDISLGLRLPLWYRDPRRGEIVSAWSGRKFIHKRVVGLPGDVIGLHGRRITVNDREICLNRDDGEVIWYSYNPTKPLPKILGENYRVPAGSFFLLGDNWEASYDSRYYGAVPRTSLTTIVTKTLWPPGRARVLDKDAFCLVPVP